MFKKSLFCLFIVLFASVNSLYSIEESQPLQFSDINQIMRELLSKHVDQKQITAEILKSSLNNYIRQFDPIKLYLLASEVRPYEEINDSGLLHTLTAYRRSDFSAFEELNGHFQQAILRSRRLREELYQDPDPLFMTQVSHYPEPEEYADTSHELKARLAKEISHFIGRQKSRFGERDVLAKKEQVLDKFERTIRAFEDGYLFVDGDEEPILETERENMLAMHVLKAMAKSLDRNSSFFTPDEAYDIRVRLEKGLFGVGLFFEDGLDGVHVSEILEMSPASKDGRISLGDRLIAIDDRSIEKDSFSEVLRKVHIDNDDEIKFTLESQSDQKPYDVTLKREPIEIEQDRVDLSYVPFANGIIGIIKLHSFYDNDHGINSENDVRTAIEELEEMGDLKGLVLDLRDNRGGYLTQAVKVAGLFITNGVVVISKYSDGEERTFRDIDGKTSYEGPMVVLVSRQTASAAEIVAQALQDWGVALVVGDDHTIGKGTIQNQTVTGAPGSSYFKVTVGHYYTVSGKSPESEGVQSDIIIPGILMVNNSHNSPSEKSTPALPAAFQDPLHDIDDSTKPWFLKYYLPTLQNPTDQWSRMTPQLKKNSQYRIDNSKSYALFLKKKTPGEEEEDLSDDLNPRKGIKNFGAEDLQLNEAVNVIKDMVRIDATQNAVGAPASYANNTYNNLQHSFWALNSLFSSGFCTKTKVSRSS